jgi:hypothetical protein
VLWALLDAALAFFLDLEKRDHGETGQAENLSEMISPAGEVDEAAVKDSCVTGKRGKAGKAGTERWP